MWTRIQVWLTRVCYCQCLEAAYVTGVRTKQLNSAGSAECLSAKLIACSIDEVKSLESACSPNVKMQKPPTIKNQVSVPAVFFSHAFLDL